MAILYKLQLEIARLMGEGKGRSKPRTSLKPQKRLVLLLNGDYAFPLVVVRDSA
jgi:hypothetical protein